MHPVEHAVATVAAAQCGVFARWQVLACGGNGALVHRRLASQRWEQLAAGVYGLPGHPPSYLRTLWVAWLSSPGAVVSHWSGGHLRRLPGFSPDRFTLSVLHGTSRANPVAQVFQTLDLPASTLVSGLPVASVERILVDVSPLVGRVMLGELIEATRTAGRTNPVRLRREVLRLSRPGRPGLRAIRDLLQRYDEGPTPPRSELERLLDRIVHRLPTVVHHEAPLPGREWTNERVDRRIEEPRRLIIEGDGRRFHARVADFRRDRERDRQALRAGYPTVRYAYEDLVDDPDGVEAELRAILGLPEQ